VNSDDLQLLVEFRNEVPAPDEATARRIYRLATTSRVGRRRAFPLHVLRRPRLVVAPAAAAATTAPRRPQLAGRRRLLALSAVATAALSLAGVLVALTLSAAQPASAYAAAKKAIAASSAGALDSGTMILRRSPDGSTWSATMTARWNGKDIAIASGGEGFVLPGFEQLLLDAGSVYLQRTDGSWLHYASEAELEPPLYRDSLQAVFGLVAGTRAAQLIASTYGLQKTVQPDGSSVYSGTIPPRNRAEAAPSDDKTGQLFLPSFGPGGAFQLVVGSDGLISKMSETASPPLTGAWSLEYSQLGSTPPITPPATYTEGTPATCPHRRRRFAPRRRSPRRNRRQRPSRNGRTAFST
jgi:hypothetical protein